MTVDLAMAKRHLNLTTADNADDVLVGEKIAAAQDWLERQLGYAIATQYPTTVPPALDQAVLLMTGHYYANREASLVGVIAAELPLGVCDIVNDYRNWSWGEADE